jgi:hypothetical protein
MGRLQMETTLAVPGDGQRSPNNTQPMKKKSTLLLLLVLSLVATIGLLVFALYPGESPIESEIRNDLDISEAWSVHLIESKTYPATGWRGPREEAIFVRSGGRRHILSLAYRHANSRYDEETHWMVDETSVMYVDGHDEWIRAERKFNHFPSQDEITLFQNDAPWY